MLATGRISPFAVQRFGYSREIERNLAEDGGPPDHLLRPPRDLLESSGEGADADGEQPFQRLAYGGHLARQLEVLGTYQRLHADVPTHHKGHTARDANQRQN
jgi:hypothetical protein